MTIKIDEVDRKIGMNIRLERVKRSISQEGLADLSGIARSTMGIVERGEQSPTIQTVAKIANALNIDIHKLFLFENL
ncbi:helix-turn-helix transcriptional regulator [bacterium]|nr:helix-turn-helix transcriptional regulator [bacterium]